MPSKSPLQYLYNQVQRSEDPFEILGLANVGGCTDAQIRSAYRSIALLLHPDKTEAHRITLHTRLFIKVQDATEKALSSTNRPTAGNIKPEEQDNDGSGLAFDEDSYRAALHRRNLDFKARLRADREKALATKHAQEERQRFVGIRKKKHNGVFVNTEPTPETPPQPPGLLRDSPNQDKLGLLPSADAGISLASKDCGLRLKTPEQRLVKGWAPRRESHKKRGDKPKKKKKHGGDTPIAPPDVIGAIQEERADYWNKSILSGAPTSISIEEKKRRGNNAAASNVTKDCKAGMKYYNKTHLLYGNYIYRDSSFAAFSKEEEEIFADMWNDIDKDEERLQLDGTEIWDCNGEMIRMSAIEE